MAKRKTPNKTASKNPLLPIAVDVDLIRFEKNLLQIGFFGANDARDKNRTSRRIEQIVSRDGHKIKVAAEFRGSEQLGLPSTTDRDKFIALLKIISEDRARTGQIDNPIRFSGYRLIQELGLSRNGEIYEEILRWGKRMTDTTITSEQVVYRAAKKLYSDETLHVFRSFRRTGISNLNGTERQEHYEVVLEDWLLENLNQRYVIPEDFNAYKQLARPTAKGIFGNLHLWFHASQGRPVEKDYAELCNLLNIQTYPHLSKIKSTMGLALNELVEIKYLSKWDVQPMSSKHGYKLVLQAGEELLRVLDNSKPDRKDGAYTAPLRDHESASSAAPAPETAEALRLLAKHGVLPAKAQQMVTRHGPESIVDTIEYLEGQALSGKRAHVANPAGLIIYSIENALPVPAGFLTGRRRRAIEENERLHKEKQDERLDAELQYAQWIERRREEALEELYPKDTLADRVSALVSEKLLTDQLFRKVPKESRHNLALQLIRKEVRETLSLPTFEDWQAENRQIPLF